MTALKDRTGQVFGMLTVTGRAENNAFGHTQWACNCSCGNTTVVSSVNLRAAKSCGCLRRKHGQSRSPDWYRWTSMKNRCHLPSDKYFKNYGARGIYVCERWRGKDGFLNYMADMGPKPSPRHTVERVDNNGPYAPENCIWATHAEQLRNRRNNRWVEHGGERLTLTDWAARLGVDNSTMFHRYARGDRGARLLRPTDSQGRRRQPDTSSQ